MDNNVLLAIQLAIKLLERVLIAQQHHSPITDEELEAKQKEVDDITDKLENS